MRFKVAGRGAISTIFSAKRNASIIRAAKADLARTGSTIRCAIYTRKSSDEGLEQEFNSLDAQREACEAYIVSQRHAGWIALSDMYDDGGLSGGTMERPALKRLLEDIKASKVQIVVVYKVDRLTRSLADFAKIVDIFDAHNASFVSVTQQFNTTTSMGRLTLNMLLSFAQFEREIVAAITRLETWIAACRVYVTSAHRPHARGSRSNVTQYQASVSSVSGDKYLNLDANGAVLNGRNRHAAPGARAGCCD